MTKVSILGCGWLGFPLAKALIKKDYIIKGSTTTADKKETLENAGITHYPISLETTNLDIPIEAFIAESETLIIAVPPKLRGKNKDYSDSNKNSFVKKIENLLPYIEKSSVQNVLFISSTAVYGEANATITEDTPLTPVTESGRQLAEIEILLNQNNHFKTTILRFGGLIGPDRNPARFLAGKENVSNPEAPINLIHLDDCIGIIIKILETKTWETQLNAVTPNHPSRKEYYTQKALDYNLVPPTFNESNPSIGKMITSDRLIQLLDYKFTQLDL
ncbi:NAD-dependent epimerase/dehydratase family protein [Flavobacterium sp.]|uniref:NAD-dependent epimerase/dehydratase family protein n=1 Tax=Flavobacterium sp. TaxID=239 RepID=UPI003C52364C